MTLALSLETVQQGRVTGRKMLVAGRRNVFKIGRLPSNDICIDDPQVSRLHATIDMSTGRPLFHDVSSVAGTMVNGTPTSRATLADNDEIQLGETLLRVRTIKPLGAPPALPTDGDRVREGIVDKLATLTPFRALKVAEYLEQLRAEKRSSSKARLFGGRWLAGKDETAKSVSAASAEGRQTPSAARALSQGVEKLTRKVVYIERDADLAAAGGPYGAPRQSRSRVPALLFGLAVAGGVAFAYSPGLSVVPAVEAPSPAAAEPAPVAAAAPVVVSAPVVAAVAPQRTVVVQAGETLSIIAQRELGDLHAWQAILAANPALQDASLIEVGMTLQLPAQQ